MTKTEPTWAAFPDSNSIGDPGRQPEIRALPGPLSVGVADTTLDFLTIGPFEIRACSSRGWSHRASGAPRQDAFALHATDDVAVIAVADGVSQGKHSHVAADTAARAACKLVADYVARAEPIDWLQISRKISVRLIEEAEYRQIVASLAPEASLDDRLKNCLTEMATTLIVSALWRDPDHQGFRCEVGVVAGDSAAYLRRAARLEPLGGGKAGGLISSTSVRPLPGAVKPVAVAVTLQPGDAVILGTDGLGDPVGEGTNDVGQELARRWFEPPTVDQFLMDVNFYRKTFDDDRTAVGLWVRPGIKLPEKPVTVEEVAARTEPDAAAAEADGFVIASSADEAVDDPAPRVPPHAPLRPLVAGATAPMAVPEEQTQAAPPVPIAPASRTTGPVAPAVPVPPATTRPTSPTAAPVGRPTAPATGESPQTSPKAVAPRPPAPAVGARRPVAPTAGVKPIFPSTLAVRPSEDPLAAVRPEAPSPASATPSAESVGEAPDKDDLTALADAIQERQTDSIPQHVRPTNFEEVTFPKG